MSKVYIQGNRITGDCKMLSPKNKDVEIEFIFANNMVEGDAIFDFRDLDKDYSIEVSHNSFYNIDSGLPPELWFVYANFLDDDKAHHNISEMVKENMLVNLRLNLNGGRDPAETARRCLEILKHNINDVT